MKKIVFVVALLASVISEAGVAEAGHKTGSWLNGNQLRQWCNEADIGLCMGYVVGVADAMEAFHSYGKAFLDWRACIPNDVTRGQLMAVAKKFLNDHPEDLHLAAVGIVAQSMVEAFPCCWN